MLKSVQLRNFRCFKNAEVDDLKRINVVVGKNATGKTALLEGIRFACSGTPNSLWALNQFRATQIGFVQPISKETFESIWSSYFYNFDVSHAIETEVTEDTGRSASCKTYFDSTRFVSGPAATVPPGNQVPVPISFVPPLAFERKNYLNESSTLLASVPGGNLNFENGPELGPQTDFFPSSGLGATPAVNPVFMFSQLSQQGLEGQIVNAVREEFDPRLENLTVLTLMGGSGIYASVKYLREKLPVGLMSSGINRFISMCAAVILRKNGIVLLDEVENGLSYKVFPALWKYLLQFAIANDTQLFVTTHSAECVRALLPAMKNKEDEFALLRAERDGDESVLTIVPGQFLESAIDQGVEVR